MCVSYDFHNKQRLFCSCNKDAMPTLNSFIPQIALTTNPQRVLHRVRSNASSFNFNYPGISIRPSSSFLRLIPRLRVTSMLSSNFPSLMCFTRQFLRKMWPIQLVFLLFIVHKIFLSSLTLSNTSFFTRSVQLIFSFYKLPRHFWPVFRV